MAIDGEFKPLSFSIPRFEEKIEALEENLEKTGRKGKDLYVNEENMFPESDLEDIMDLLEDADLNGVFPYDITTDPEPSQVGVRLEDQTFAPTTQVSEIKTPPLPKQPEPVAAAAALPKIDPVTQLTSTEMALLSPDEQAIRLKQRGIA